MTLMQVFDMPTRTLMVDCEADMRLPNTDVMFVLDTTGSMNDPASPGDPRKIDTLHFAVKCFYETLARLDTDAVCNPGAGPTGGVGGDVQIRFGFMPYATNVNVGRLLPTSYFANSWSYQSRVPSGTYTAWSSPTNSGTAALNGSGGCDTPVGSTLVQYTATKQTPAVGAPYCQIAKQTRKIIWRYFQNPSVDISGLKNGSSWNASVTLPGIGNDGANKIANWEGCIEERHTVRATNYSPRPAGANDLDFETLPTAGDPDSLWGPALPGAVYVRKDGSGNASYPEVLSATDFPNPAPYTDYAYNCPNEARKLQTWSASAFDSYVDSLAPEGNTYHDIGLLWGARFLSPDGIFAAENRTTPRGGKIQRNIIFMTDGVENAPETDYNAYGLPYLDRRQTPVATAPTRDDLNSQVNARFTALCTAITNRYAGADKITLWVISFGNGSNAATDARLKSCATDDGHFYIARSATSLKAAFQSIANQISQLRLTQ